MTPLFFFTYTRFVPTGQIGIFKRCLRLIPYLDDFEIHLVNFGPFRKRTRSLPRFVPD